MLSADHDDYCELLSRLADPCCHGGNSRSITLLADLGTTARFRERLEPPLVIETDQGLDSFVDSTDFRARQAELYGAPSLVHAAASFHWRGGLGLHQLLVLDPELGYDGQ